MSRVDAMPMLPAMADMSAEVLAGVESSEVARSGEYSAARFFSRSPAMYAAIAKGVAEGLGDACLSRMFGCHDRTVAAIRRREIASMTADEYRSAQGARLRGVVVGVVDEIDRRVRDAPTEIAFKDLVSAADKLSSHERLLAGEPSAIVGHLESAGAAEDVRELLRSGGSNPFGRRDLPVEIPAPDGDEARARVREEVGSVEVIQAARKNDG